MSILSRAWHDARAACKHSASTRARAARAAAATRAASRCVTLRSRTGCTPRRGTLTATTGRRCCASSATSMARSCGGAGTGRARYKGRRRSVRARVHGVPHYSTTRTTHGRAPAGGRGRPYAIGDTAVLRSYGVYAGIRDTNEILTTTVRMITCARCARARHATPRARRGARRAWPLAPGPAGVRGGWAGSGRGVSSSALALAERAGTTRTHVRASALRPPRSRSPHSTRRQRYRVQLNSGRTCLWCVVARLYNISTAREHSKSTAELYTGYSCTELT